MLEQIVKRFAPFVDAYRCEGFDEKGRVGVPKP